MNTKLTRDQFLDQMGTFYDVCNKNLETARQNSKDLNTGLNNLALIAAGLMTTPPSDLSNKLMSSISVVGIASEYWLSMVYNCIGNDDVETTSTVA